MNRMMEAEKWAKRPLSKHQIGTLRYVATEDVRIEELGQAQMNTLGSLLQRRYLARSGDRIVVTASGLEALRDYEKNTWAERKTPGPLTDRVSSLLRYARLKVAAAGRSLPE